MRVFQALLGSYLLYFPLVLKLSAVEVFFPNYAAAFPPVRYLLCAQHIFFNDLRINQSLPSLVDRVIYLYAAFCYQIFRQFWLPCSLISLVSVQRFFHGASGDDIGRIVDLIEAAARHHRALLWRSVQIVGIAEGDCGHRVEPTYLLVIEHDIKGAKMVLELLP